MSDAPSLQDLIRRAFDEGAEDVVLRVSRYDEKFQAAAWQAVVRPADYSLPVRVGVLGDPVAALLRALEPVPEAVEPSVFD